jgi:hypothetical protein
MRTGAATGACYLVAMNDAPQTRTAKNPSAKALARAAPVATAILPRKTYGRFSAFHLLRSDQGVCHRCHHEEENGQQQHQQRKPSDVGDPRDPPSRAPTRQCAVERPTEEREPDHDQDPELDDALEYVTATAITAKEHADPCTPQPPGPWRAADHGVDGDQRQPAQDAPTGSPLAWSPGHGPKLYVARRYLCSRMKPEYTVSGKDNTVVTRRYCSR